MNCILRKKDFAGFYNVLSWVLSRFNSSKPSFGSAYQGRPNVVLCCAELGFVDRDATTIHGK